MHLVKNLDIVGQVEHMLARPRRHLRHGQRADLIRDEFVHQRDVGVHLVLSAETEHEIEKRRACTAEELGTIGEALPAHSVSCFVDDNVFAELNLST